jgi:hypothetical protein
MSHPREAACHQPKTFSCLLSAVLCLLLMAIGALAQSTEIDFPTPVRASEINGLILPRDVGDPRPTRHFYSLTGTPGDLVITVESKNLDGDVDLFTAGTLRPLAKISLYAGEAATSASKSIYLKRREALVLRIEARSPNETQGGYRIRFEGAFEPISGEVATAPESNTPNTTGRADQKTRRVTSVGARIEEPPAPAETSKAAEPAPTPRTSETASAESTDTGTPTESKPVAPEPKPKPPARTARNRRPTRTRTARAPRPAPAAEKTTTAPVEPVQAEAEPKPVNTPAPTPASPRLIIETRDGIKVERFMNTVRRVIVEGGQVIIITKDGKVERQPLTNILRMSIEP